YAGPFASIGALLEANALRRGERGASIRSIEHFARILDAAPPLAAGVSNRARAYARDSLGRPEEAIRLLERARDDAARYGRSIDEAIARHQWGLRVRGDEGRAACEEARRSVREAGASERLLDEDAGLR